MDSEDEDQDEKKSLESSRSNEDLEYSTRIKSTISTAAKLSTSQDSIAKSKPLASTATLVNTKPSDKNKKKLKGNSNKITSRVAAFLGFGKCDGSDQTKKSRNVVSFFIYRRNY